MVLCSNGIECSGSPVYTSTLQLSLGKAVNSLQMGCETNAFGINGSAVGPLTADHSQCPSFGSTSVHSTTAASTPVVLGIADGQSSTSATATNTSIFFAPTSFVGASQSSAAVNGNHGKRHVSFSLLSAAILVIFSLWSQAAYAYDASKDHRAVEDMLYSPFAQVEPPTAQSKRSPLGASMNDSAAMFSVYRSWFENNESFETASLYTAGSRIMTDIFHFACAAVWDLPESDVGHQANFAHHWKECVVYTEQTFMKSHNRLHGSHDSEPLAVHGFIQTALTKGLCDLAFASILMRSFDGLATKNLCSSILPVLESSSVFAPSGTPTMTAASTVDSDRSGSNFPEPAISSYFSNYIAKNGFESSTLPPSTSIGPISSLSLSSHLPTRSTCISSNISIHIHDSESTNGPGQSITSSIATKSGSSSGDIDVSSGSIFSHHITSSHKPPERHHGRHWTNTNLLQRCLVLPAVWSSPRSLGVHSVSADS